MAGSKKKKVGGIKARVKTPARAPARSPEKKKVGGVAIKHHYCAQGCEGEWRERMWIHSQGCPETRMIWKAHGQRIGDWICWYGCPGQEMPSGFTHHWECEFWDRNPVITPFQTEKEAQECLRSGVFSQLHL